MQRRFPFFVRAVLFLACLRPLVAWASFVEVSEEIGLVYQHADKQAVPTNFELGLQRETLTPVSNHAGAAAFDANGDGWTDFIAGRYNEVPVLFMNQGDGSFDEQASIRGLGTALDAAAFGAGDFDNDGDQDLLAVPHRGERFFLFVNDGSGHFTEEAVLRGAALESVSQAHEGYSVGLVDYDLDGFLDIYVSEWGPDDADEFSSHSVLLRNLGESSPGHFENVTESAGLLQPEQGIDSQYGFSSAWADFDEDGWPDLSLIVDFGGSRMYWNRGDGSFDEGTDAAGVGLEESGMGIAVADYDLDGDLDFFATSIYDEEIFVSTGTNTGNKLYRNNGERNFAEVATEAGLAKVGWAWGAAFFEFDNDGDADLLVTNGMDAAEEDPLQFQDALDDPTSVFVNDGNGAFADITWLSGVSDTGYGKAIVVFDYDNDGDEDFVVTQTFGPPRVYRSNAIENGNKWLRIKFTGTVSNRDGIGALVRVTYQGSTQTALYNPSNAYIGQREPFLHFGLGDADETIAQVEVLWPSGAHSLLEGIEVDQVLEVIEPEPELGLPEISEQPLGGSFVVGEPLLLELELDRPEGAAVIWEKDGVALAGETETRLYIKRVQPFDAGEYRAKVVNAAGATYTDTVAIEVGLGDEQRSVARLWNEFLLDSIRTDFPDPTKHARNLYHHSAVMWDCFWAYEPAGWSRATAVFHQETIAENDRKVSREESQREALSYASYRLLVHRYQASLRSERILYNLRWLMLQLGYDPDFLGESGNTPAAVGNRIAARTISICLEDGSNEENGYEDLSEYVPVNEPLAFKIPGTQMEDPNRWQPLAFDTRITQNGILVTENVQSFVGSNWRTVDAFALPKVDSQSIAWDPGAPPLFGEESQAEFVDAAVEVIRYSSYLDTYSGEQIDISPAGLLNNPIGTNDGLGRSLNPVTGEPYQPNVVNLADYGRILAEFWADGPASETPPGHWNTLLNNVADHPLFERRYLGVGDELSCLEWDVQAYLALNGAMHDAAIAAWTLKRQYDYARPISMIRYLGGIGQSSDPGLPSHHPDGLPLVEGLIELVTEESSAAGQRHSHLATRVGSIAVRAWSAEPVSSAEEQSLGVGWILAEEWMPYQRRTFVSPAFAGYVSGHSTFSRAAAEVLTLLTGSPFFPGGMGEYSFPKGEFLEFDQGPSEDLTLQWATYFDAADQAGLSRLFGGIHVRADDLKGRKLGARVGVEAFLKAHSMRVAKASVSAETVYEIEHDFDSPAERLFKLDTKNEGSSSFSHHSSWSEARAESQEGVRFVSASDLSSGFVLKKKGVKKVTVERAGTSIRFRVEPEDAGLYSVRAWRGRLWKVEESESSAGESPSVVVLRIQEDSRESELARIETRSLGAEDSTAWALALRSGYSSEQIEGFEVACLLVLNAGVYRLSLQNDSDSLGQGVVLELENLILQK